MLLMHPTDLMWAAADDGQRGWTGWAVAESVVPDPTRVGEVTRSAALPPETLSSLEDAHHRFCLTRCMDGCMDGWMPAMQSVSQSVAMSSSRPLGQFFVGGLQTRPGTAFSRFMHVRHTRTHVIHTYMYARTHDDGPLALPTRNT
eukprot:GHVU01194194.1.p1 GENE.GHVU01194194.1~~GHVU01194194.1.p1  ORF type:complete len:145 (-),score=7.78 GHVU01194194.1:407-841(-)